MPPILERALLDYFRGETRPTRHKFGDYVPADVTFAFSLSRFLSRNFGGLTAADLLGKVGKQ